MKEISRNMRLIAADGKTGTPSAVSETQKTKYQKDNHALI